MDNREVFRESTRLVQASKFAWIYSGISLASVLVPSEQTSKDNLLLPCISLMLILAFLIISIVFAAGLAYDISHKHLKLANVSIRDGWAQGKSSLGQIFGFYLVLGIPLVLALLLGRLVLPQTSLGVATWVLVELLVTPLSGFGICAIVMGDIEKQNPVSIAWRVFRDNWGRVFVFSAWFVIIESALFVFLALVVFMSPLSPNVSFPLDFNPATWLNILQVPTVGLLSRVLPVLFYPWKLATFSIAYLVLTEKLRLDGKLPKIER
jgi:hypothetical protein